MTDELAHFSPACQLLWYALRLQSKSGGPPMPLTVVFVERKTRCDEVAEALRQEGIPAVALHGGLSQVSSGRGGVGQLVRCQVVSAPTYHQTEGSATAQLAVSFLRESPLNSIPQFLGPTSK
jgi:hypothetical protein